MDRVSEKERSSRRSRDDDRDREASKDHHRDREASKDHHRDCDRDREQKHRHRHRLHGDEKRRREDGGADDNRRRHRSLGEDSASDDARGDDKERRGHRHRSRDEDSASDVDARGEDKERRRRRHRSPEDSPSDPHPRRERSSSRAADSVERDAALREQSSRKRRDHGTEEREETERDGKRAKGHTDATRHEKRERRRFEEDSRGNNGYYKDAGEKEKVGKVRRRDVDTANDRDKKGDTKEANGERKSGSTANVAAQGPLTVASKVPVTSAAGHSLPTKVSLITTTNENEGVSSRSDEVYGKSSTDGTAASLAGKSGNLSLDALAKAKKALQLQKELSEKLKKLPVLNKLGSTQSENSQMASKKDEYKFILSASGIQLASSGSTIAPPIYAQSNLAIGGTSGKADATSSLSDIPGLTNIPNLEAVKRAQELAAKMGFRQDPEFAPLINMFPGSTNDVVAPQRPAKAPVLRLDSQGREIDEHGNVINMPKLTNLSTLKVNINKQKKEAFQIIRPDLDAVGGSNPHFDANMGINKTKLLRPRRPGFQFVEEGRLSKLAELQRIRNQFGEAQAKELKVKQAQLAKAKAEVDINPNLISVAARVPKQKPKDDIPEIEWWDKQILLSATYEDVPKEILNMDKITIYVEHPRPIEPPAEPAPPPPQPLKLTKKEQKKLRTQRRLAKERDRQEMIRQGLLEPPKPKIKMSNLMRVLGSEATQDPTRLEMEIRSAAAEREQAHVDRNIARKLTPAERREKKERKLFEDPSTLETLVSVYKIRDLSHPQTRFKVDVNAQENRLTGCAVISDGISVVVVEGGRKSIKRYGKLMLNRIDWASAVSGEDGTEEGADAPANSCVLVWQGSVAKPSFNKFLVHQCRSEAAARKVLADAGVPHYWDLSINFSEELM